MHNDDISVRLREIANLLSDLAALYAKNGDAAALEEMLKISRVVGALMHKPADA